MTEFEELLFESVNKLQSKIEALEARLCNFHTQLSGIETAVARIDERQKIAGSSTTPEGSSGKTRNAVAVTVSLAGAGAGIWQFVKWLFGSS